MALAKPKQSNVEREVAHHKTRPGYEPGMFAEFEDDSPRLVGTHVSWRLYVRLWNENRLKFQREGKPKPKHYPSLPAALILEQIERGAAHPNFLPPPVR